MIMKVFNRKQLPRCLSLLSRSKPLCNINPPPLSHSVGERALNPKPTSTHLHSSIFSDGFHSIRSCTGSVYHSMIRVDEKIRSFLVSASELENVCVVGSDDSASRISCVDENLKNDDRILTDDDSALNDDNLSNASSKVANVDENVSNRVYDIVEAIRNRKDEIVPQGETISIRLTNEIFHVLNSEKLSGIPFFVWARYKNPQLFKRADFPSLIIDNCGWLEDYDAMRRLLNEFSTHDVCLTNKAFGFFASLGMDKDLTMATIRKVVDILKEVGGTCRGTGLFGLIKSLCKLDLVEMALFVIQTTDKKISYYNVIVQEMCLRSRFDEANDLLEEMCESNCGPDALSYTYILSALCKNDRIKEVCDLFEEIKEKGCKPDALHFELIILYMCKHGKLEIASQYFGRLVSEGLEPRINTNAALIKGYFNSEKYEEAHKFVVKLGLEHKSCGNTAYSLLAHLHCRKKDVVTAGKLLIEMMDNNFIPNFVLHQNVCKGLCKVGQKQMANDIKAKFFKLKNGTRLLTEKRR